MERRLLDQRYELDELIGSGGMGRVHAATDQRLGRRVAVKVLHPERGDAATARRLELEAVLAARIHHPNVVGVFDAGRDADGAPYVVMELVRGVSLREHLAARGPLPVERAADVAAQVLAGLGALHDAGLLHRDVTPANVLLTADGTVKLADLGIARPVERGSDDLTRPGDLLGTAAYLAPERALGEPATPASDLYACAVVLYEAVTGSSPYPTSSSGAAALAHLTDEATPVREVRPEVPAALATVIHRGLAKEPTDRPPDAASMRQAVLDSFDDLPTHRTTAALPVVDVPVEGEPTLVDAAMAPDRRRWRGLLAGAVAVAVAVAAGFGLAAATLDGGDGGDVAVAAAATLPPTTTTTVASTTTVATSSTTVPTTTTPPTTVSSTTTTEAPGLPTDLDGLIDLVEEDPAAVGERGRQLLEKIDGYSDFDSRKIGRVIADIERWLERDRIDPEVGAAVIDALERRRASGDDDEGDA